jgi:hypothetical protein
VKEEIKMMLDYLQKLTKDEADLISAVLTWPDEYRTAYKIAKDLFEDED